MNIQPNSSANDLARKSLDDLKAKEKEAIPSYEHLKEIYKKPDKHMCERCMDEYDAYNREQKLRDPKWEDRFPTCNGSLEIPPISLQKYADINGASIDDVQDEYDFIRINHDPVLWGAAQLSIITDGVTFDRDGEPTSADRWYQRDMLRCLNSSTYVHMSDGKVTRIKDLQVGDKVLSYNEVRREFPSSYKVVNKWNNGFKDCYRISLENGDKLECTSNHPILAHFKSGELNQLHDCKSYKTTYASMDDGLTVGNKVYTMNRFDAYGDVDDVDLAKILGYLVTDGYVNLKECKVVFTNINESYITEFEDLVKKVFPSDTYKVTWHPSRIRKDGITRKAYGDVAVHKGALHEFLSSINVTGKYTREQGLLEYAFNFSLTATQAFINRAWAGDGSCYCSGKAVSLRLASGNPEYLELFRILLKKVGVVSSKIWKDKLEGNGYSLEIRQAVSVQNFFNEVGPIYGKEEQSLECLELVNKVIESDSSYRKRGRFGATSRTKIESIEYIGKHEVWDIEVNTRHNFVANGVVVHNCSAQFKAYRCGRRTGKCLKFSSLCSTEQGLISVAELASMKQKPRLITFNQDTLKLEYTDKYSVFPNGKKPIVRITTQSGRIAEVSENHPMYIYGPEGFGWIRADQLNIKDHLALTLPENLSELYNGNSLTPEESRILGYLSGDGGTSANFISFSNIDNGILSDLGELVKSYNCTLIQYKYQAVCDYRIVKNPGTGKFNNLIAFCDKHELMHTKAIHKKVPNAVFTSSLESISNFLGAYWDCDGWLTLSKYDNTEIGAVSASKELARGIKSLLEMCGIQSSLKYKKVKYKDGYNGAYSVCVSDKENQLKFMERIPLRAKEYKKSEIISALDRKTGRSTSFYGAFSSNAVSVITEELGISKRKCLGSGTVYPSISRNKLKNIVDRTSSKEANRLVNSDIYTEEIVEIEILEEAETYDLTVPSTSTIVHDGVISHNTYSMRWETLHFMITNPGVEVLLICPFEKQVMAFLKDIDDFISESPELKAALKHRSKSKHTITFNNGSHLESVMTGGDKAGGGSKARGQPADLLVFDEVDYIAPKDIEAAIAILADKPKCKILVSSTPTGKRQFFYDICTDKKRRYKEFNMASHVSPVYNKIADDEVRAASSTSAYRREMLAEFGEETTGVFSQLDIDRSRRAYSLALERQNGPLPGWVYMIGVDWNGRAIGTHICVVGFNPQSRKYRLVDKIVVANEQYTQIAGCTAIVNAFQYWGASHIYADFGAGETQGEMVTRHAVQTGNKRLAANFKPIIMHGSTEVRNPASGHLEKRVNQQFAIDLLTHHLEQAMIELPMSEEFMGGDESEMGLVSQMRHFSVEKISVSGKPVYCGVDHTLTAFYLTILAFQLEKSSTGVTRYDNNVIIKAIGDLADGETVQGVYEREKERKDQKGIAPGMFQSRALTSGGKSVMYGNIPGKVADGKEVVMEESEASISGSVAMSRKGVGQMINAFLHKRASF